MSLYVVRNPSLPVCLPLGAKQREAKAIDNDEVMRMNQSIHRPIETHDLYLNRLSSTPQHPKDHELAFDRVPLDLPLVVWR